MHFGLLICVLSTLAVAVRGDGREAGRRRTSRRTFKHVVHEARPAAAARHWIKSSRLHPAAVMALRIGLVQTNLDKAERLLRTQYHVYRHSVHGMPHVAFDSRLGAARLHNRLPLPEEQHTGLRRRSLTKRQSRNGGLVGRPDSGFGPKQGATIENALVEPGRCDSMITPACLRAMYSIPPGETSFGTNTLGIVEFTPQAFLQADLDLYFDQFESRLRGKSPILTLLDNGVVQTQNKSFAFNGESALGLQFAMSLIYPQQATLFQVGDLHQSASFNNFLDSIDGSYCDFMGGDSIDPNVDAQYSKQAACGTSDPTNVISISYGYNGGDLGPRYEQRQRAEYMKLGLRGVSVLLSSGDSGVAGNGGQCIDPATGAYNSGRTGIFNPSFPGGCPWVTSVGATQVLNGSSVHGPESACEKVIFSGGGFSNTFAMPEYQKKALATYFAESPPPYGHERFNNSRNVRGFPDVAANGANYVTAVNSKFTLSFGTSASAPVFASVLTLVNEKRLNAGKSPVGFVNPVLYAHPEALNDITNGKNPGCGTDGFTAVPGWDPVTGLGTPNYERLEALFMSLP